MGWLADILKEFPAVSVARERLALVEQKYSDLEGKYDDACEEIKGLKAENSGLRARLGELETSLKIPEVSSEFGVVLVYLFKHTDFRQTHSDTIAQAFGIEPQVVQYYLDKLYGLGLVQPTAGSVRSGACYGLTTRGRAYVVEKGLLEKQ